jgi:hypothetical protein
MEIWQLNLHRRWLVLKQLRSTVLYLNLCETKKIIITLISNSDAILIVICHSLNLGQKIGGIIMLGRNYFESRLNEIYNYCLLGYISGTGELVSTSSRYNINWELCQDITGEILFILSSSLDIKFDNQGDFIHFSFNGISSNGLWEANSPDLIIHSQKFGWAYNNERFTHFCTANMITLKHIQNYRDNNFSKALACLYNFKFEGLDFSQYEQMNKKDKFICQTQDRDILFKLVFEDRNIKELIETKRIQKAVFSTLEYPMHEGESMGFCKKEIEKICWFLSMSTLNTNFSPIIEYYSGEEKVAITIYNVLGLRYHGNVIVDNYQVKAGIPSFFTQCFTNYVTLSNSFDINQFISLILDLQSQHHIELKIATLLLAYENLLSQYLVYRGIPQDSLRESNVEQKLRMFNNFYRFIPRDLLGEDLRDSVRNPLFHLGNIPFLTFEETIETFEKYYELLVQILLKILDYHGEYINRLDFTNSTI